MKSTIGKLARIVFGLALVAAVGAETAAQITIKCWKEGCITVNGQTSCIREEIPCPNET
jgi:hypothetical protein